ncbi:hypothetical protein ACQKH5_18230 [Hyphomonas sp. NPDC076900]|uniref:hypothetical protein n=1 Tax=unclassified Hyphomonas TaxID=2630699 RepID=UPI003D08C9C2
MSRRSPGDENAAPCAQCGLSRRELIAGSAALALPAGPTGTADPVIPICQNWLRLNAEQDALTLRWQDLECFVGREYKWFRLSEAERQLVPEAAEMAAIDQSVDALFTTRQDILSRLPDMKAMSLYGVSLKLSVATASVFPDEHPEVHALLQSTLNDLTTLMEAGGSLRT